MKYSALAFLLLLPMLLWATDEILVRLPTEAELVPVYLLDWEGEGETKELLRKTLAFDLDHNGRTQLAPVNSERQLQASRDVTTRSFNGPTWEKLGVPYVLQGSQEERALTLRLFSSRTGEATATIRVPLSGEIGRDRQKIHMASDALFKALFGVEGIASTRILYTVRKGESSEVYIADYDGKNARQVTHDGDYCVTPAFLPPEKGKRAGSFFYTAYRGSQPKIYVASLKGGSGRRLSSLRGQQLMPAVTRNRHRVAFISDAGGNPDLFIQQFDPALGVIGKPRQIFSAPRAVQASPSFNPLGDRLAFVSDKDGTARIYAMTVPAAGTEPNPTLVSHRCRGSTSPCWSPDGRKIAFSGMTDGTRQIWVFDFEKDAAYQLTSGPGHKENPSWAPDSLHLVFNSATRTGCELYLVDLKRRKPTRISMGPGEKRFPAWEPRPE